MFRHVVLLEWVQGVREADVQAVLDALSDFSTRYPELRSYRFGTDAGLSDGNFDLAIVADFDDAAAYHRFHHDEHHQRLLVEVIRPIVARRAAVQHDW